MSDGAVLEIIRSAVAGSMKAGLVGGGSPPYDGIQAVRIGDWRIRVHLDAGSLDYVDGATAPDGRVWGYREVGGILRKLDVGERRAVQAWLAAWNLFKATSDFALGFGQSPSSASRSSAGSAAGADGSVPSGHGVRRARVRSIEAQRFWSARCIAR